MNEQEIKTGHEACPLDAVVMDGIERAFGVLSITMDFAATKLGAFLGLNAVVSCLHLTLSKEPFEVMVTGEKKEEFRKNSEWIRSRLFDPDRIMERHYTHIKFVNGYGSDKPYFICKFEGFLECYMDVTPREYSNGLRVYGIGKGDFIIYCGEIVEIGNWPKGN